MPEVSVIMGVYNCPAKEMLMRAVDSILNQSFTDFEFIICDDGSTNDTPKWLDEKAKTDPRIRLIKSKENHGLALALNRCLELVQGCFVARQDADDYSAPSRLRTELDFLKTHRNIAFVGTDCFVYDANSLYGEWHRPEYPSKRDFLFNSPFIHGTTMFRREVFEKCGGYRLIGKCRKYEDYDFFMRAYAAGFQGANINQLLYTFFSEEKKNYVSRKMRLDEFHVRKNGFRSLGFGWKQYPYVLKPLALILVPNKLLCWIKDYKKNMLLHRRSLSVKLYVFIVNRNSYIKFNYERYVNNNRVTHKRFPILSWLYLLKLNVDSLVFKREVPAQEVPKRLKRKESAQGKAPSEIAESLCAYDVVSFDVFDTLIFRPFAVPSDLFYCVGEKLNYPDFHTIRMEAEQTVRRNYGSEKVSLKDIYDFIADRTGIDSETGQQAEMNIEIDLCEANPYLKQVWEYVKASGKRIILTSDMYLPSECIARMLEKCGYTGYNQIFISCECGCGKHEGKLYDYIKEKIGTERIAHIGDNYLSDVQNARKHRVFAVPYRNVNSYGNFFRPKEMSPIIGSAYSGIINQRMYSGELSFSPAYEYGYKYGGLLILGFCEYIHKIAEEQRADGILFLSRDGYIVKKVYDELYPESCTKYIYWSRNAAAKIGADLFRNNFMRRFITQKINSGVSLYDVMRAIGIAGWSFPFDLSDELTMQNAGNVEDYIRHNWNRLMQEYKPIEEAAHLYFTEMLGGFRNVITVDCGWAGSGNIILEQIVNRKWGMNCRFTGVLAGSNSYSQHDSDYSETFLLNGKLQVYCFSSGLNRDKFMAHMPGKKHNIYFELLFSAPEPSFQEFCMKDDSYGLVFDHEAENDMYIREIQKGELDFIRNYLHSFSNYPYMRNISGSDAYTPFMDAMRHSQRYIDKVFAECIFDETTNGKKVRIK